MAKKILPAIEEFKKRLRYCPKTGLTIWLISPNNQLQPGSRAGNTNPNGYRHITIFGRRWAEHRLAWFLMTGCLPASQIDHKNGNRSDNRWCNLRPASACDNARNAKKRLRRVSEFKGIFKNTQGWTARVMIDGKRRSVGTFETAREAHNAYCRAATKHYGEFARFE